MDTDNGLEIVHEFLVESHEGLDQLDRDLVALEQEPHSRELLSGIFRTIHTIKGTCGFLGFGKLERVAHAGENLLSKLRDGEIELRPDVTTGLLSLVDTVRRMLDCIESLGYEGDEEYADLIGTLIALQELRLEGEPLGQPADAAALPEWREESNALPQPQAADLAARDEPLAADARGPAVSDSSIRVDVALLDRLMNQVGELVLARNQILQFTSGISDTVLINTSQRLNLITTELQEGVMKTRMQPIGNIWSKFPRVVRDLAMQCGKQVRVEMEGKETELDKTIVEAIKDPLTHLVRNSVDHGIETPEARRACGKPAEGRLLLRAFHEGGQVNIEIGDDGAGLDLERIRQKAVERGIVSQDQAVRMSDREAAALIFAPGFSTAAAVTNVSGRGVGMDVVKTNIEKIGGTVDIQTLAGQGATVKLKIPLTLAIIPALTVTCAGDRYAIPQVSLLELVRLEGEQARRGIEQLHGAPVYRLRGRLLPIVDLRGELSVEGQSSAEPSAMENDIINIVVLRADDRQFGLIVDAINDTEEIVVKPLSKQLKGIPVYAGATIMGDGAVALILDVLGIAQRAHIVTEERGAAPSQHQNSAGEHALDRQTLLILSLGERRIALPLSTVSRLEEISHSLIENADNREVVQYRGQILPLIRLGKALSIDACPSDDDRPLQVVVYSENGRSVGLVVDRIVDIVDAAIDSQQVSENEDLLASLVVQERVTDLLNLPAVIRRQYPKFSGTPSNA